MSRALPHALILTFAAPSPSLQVSYLDASESLSTSPTSARPHRAHWASQDSSPSPPKRSIHSELNNRSPQAKTDLFGGGPLEVEDHEGLQDNVMYESAGSFSFGGGVADDAEGLGRALLGYNGGGGQRNKNGGRGSAYNGDWERGFGDRDRSYSEEEEDVEEELEEMARRREEEERALARARVVEGGRVCRPEKSRASLQVRPLCLLRVGIAQSAHAVAHSAHWAGRKHGGRLAVCSQRPALAHWPRAPPSH
eukprot:2157947-Rhodomonas_salina.1